MKRFWLHLKQIRPTIKDQYIFLGVQIALISAQVIAEKIRDRQYQQENENDTPIDESILE